jgi:hypothetical protein
MCEVENRRWREALRPMRIALGLAALGCLAGGTRYPSVFGLGIIGFGAALLLAAVVLPTVREVEFGLPVGVKVSTAVRRREESLREAFEVQKAELELCSQLLCGGPEAAGQLLEAAWARTATIWRGPVTAALYDHVLCVLVELARAREIWMDPEPESIRSGRTLRALPFDLRVAIVLHEFGGLPLARIGALTGRSMESVEGDVRAAEATLARAALPGSGA